MFLLQLVKELLQVYKHIMSLKSVELLEEAYRHVLGDLELTFNTLLEESESDYQCSLVASNPYTGVKFLLAYAKTRQQFKKEILTWSP